MGLGKPCPKNMMFCTWASSHNNKTANPSTEVKGNLGTATYSFLLSALLKYTLQEINYTIAAWHNPKVVLLLAA
jgi:hypothetical protein